MPLKTPTAGPRAHSPLISLLGGLPSSLGLRPAPSTTLGVFPGTPRQLLRQVRACMLQQASRCRSYHLRFHRPAAAAWLCPAAARVSGGAGGAARMRLGGRSLVASVWL